MKPGSTKSYLPLVLILGTVVLILIAILTWGNRAARIPGLIRGIIPDAVMFYRAKIAYLAAIILVGGSIFISVRQLFRRDKCRDTIGEAPREVPSKPGIPGPKNKIIIPLLGVISVLPGAWFFYRYSFPPAFAFAALVVGGFMFLARQDHKKLSILAVVMVLLFWAPYLVRGPNLHVKIFDNLDCHIAHSRILAESGKTFSLNPQTKLDNFLNGIHLSGVDSGFNVLTWLFMIFPPFIAYALNDLLVRLVALLGMVLLLKKHIIKPGEEEQYPVIIGSALCFALLPFYPAGGISVAGIPLLLYSFLNILDHQGKTRDFLVILLFPFYSKLALAGFFIAVGLFILFIMDWIRKKKINFASLGALAVLTLAYCFTHFHLLYSFLSPDFVSYREEINAAGISTAKAMKYAIDNFIFDRVNEVGAQNLFVIGAAALATVVSIIKKIKVRLMPGLVFFTLATAFMWGFKYWAGIIPLREKYQVLNAFDFSRFYWLNPFLWYLVFALALPVILKIKPGKILVFLLILGQVLFMFMFYNWEYRHLLGIRNSFAGSPLTYSLTYKEFYSEGLFEEIDHYINKPKKDYRVVSLGIPPGISQYNGYYTLDIYTDVYTLEYKHRFREIIEKEMEKNSYVKRVFDENAKRCYLFVSDLYGKKGVPGMIFTRGITKNESPGLKVRNLDLNTAAFKELGGEYIFSAVEIADYAENRLSFEKVFEHKESPWRIYLYRAI